MEYDEMIEWRNMFENDYIAREYVLELEEKFERKIDIDVDDKMFIRVSYKRIDSKWWPPYFTSFVIKLDNFPKNMDLDQTKLFEYVCTILSLIRDPQMKRWKVIDDEIEFIRKIQTVLHNAALNPEGMEYIISHYQERV